MADFTAYNSRWRVACLIILSLAFVVAGLWMVGALGAPPSSRRYPAPVVTAVGWLCLVFFGVCGIGWAKKLFDSSVQLRVGATGISWQPWSDQLIPWSEVRDVSTWSVKRQKFVVLHLRNPDRYPGRGFAATMTGVNRTPSGGHVCISVAGLDRGFDDVIDAIGRFRR